MNKRINKNGLLICSGESPSKNIGDYIQSVAQEQFYDHIDCYVERERLNTYDDADKINVIMNAWFMRHPENFPPSQCINPLFISFHIAPAIANRMLNPQTIDYLRKYEPIGARDIGTKELLESYGIKCYFSGCLTLTLGLNYKSFDKSNEIIFVDPYYELGAGYKYPKIVQVLSSFIYLIKYFSKIKLMEKGFINERITRLSRISPRLERLMWCASFYHYYSTLFDDDVLIGAVYIKHEILQRDFKNDDEKMEYARCLLRRYAKAKFVVTSRLHCAIPCLGIETPVLFVTSEALEQGKLRSPGRFKGLMELLHYSVWTRNGLIPQTKEIRNIFASGKIHRNTTFSNPGDYLPLKEKLIQLVKDFIKNNSN